MGKVPPIDGVYVDRKIMIPATKFKWKGLNGYPSDVWYSGITLTNKVKMIDPCIFTIDLSDVKTSHTLYYDPGKEYVDPALILKIN